MSSKKRIALIAASLVGTPILFFVIGAVAGSFYPHQGSGWGVAIIWLFLGFLSMFASLAAGPIVSYAVKYKHGNPWFSLSGYIGPPIISLVIGIAATISAFAGA